MAQPHRHLAFCAMAFGFAGVCAAAEDAERQFEALFGKDLRRVTAAAGTRDDAELGTQILDAARRAKGLPELRALMCQKAYELAIRDEAGYATAIAAAKALAQLVPDRAADCQEKLLKAYRLVFAKARAAKRLAAGKQLAEQLLLVADLKAKTAQWAEAESLYRQALGVATSLRLAVRPAILEKIRQAAAARQIHLRKTYLEGRLVKAPADLEARADLIRLYVIDMDRPDEAAGLLTDGLDEALRTYVPLAAKPIEDVPPQACLELAEWYRGLSAKAAKAGRVTALGRAKQYYERFLSAGQPKDVARVKVQVELKDVTGELAKLVGEDKPALALPGAVLVMTFDKDTLFEEDGHAFVRDLSGRGNHALVVGAAPTAGLAGEALAFDGQDDFVSLGNPRWLQITGSMTIAMWLWPQQLGARRNPFNKAYGGEGTITLERSGTAHFYWGTSGADKRPFQRFLMRTPIPAGEWTHLVVVRDLRNGQMRWYRNGVLAVQAAASYPAARPSKAKAYLGKGYAGSFFGKMDEVAIFAGALSAAEVKALYDFGRDGKSLR